MVGKLSGWVYLVFWVILLVHVCLRRQTLPNGVLLWASFLIFFAIKMLKYQL